MKCDDYASVVKHERKKVFDSDCSNSNPPGEFWVWPFWTRSKDGFTMLVVLDARYYWKVRSGIWWCFYFLWTFVHNFSTHRMLYSDLCFDFLWHIGEDYPSIGLARSKASSVNVCELCLHCENTECLKCKWRLNEITILLLSLIARKVIAAGMDAVGPFFAAHLIDPVQRTGMHNISSWVSISYPWKSSLYRTWHPPQKAIAGLCVNNRII